MVSSLWTRRCGPGLSLGVLREAWRNDREKLGLLRLLLAEIEHNAEVTRTVREKTQDLLYSSDFIRSVKTETWRDVRTGAARLFPVKLTGALNDYYSPLQTLLTLQQFENSTIDLLDRRLRRGIVEVRPQWSVARTRNPYDDYRDRVLRTQEEAQKRIKEYLELAWWRRVFGYE